MAIQSARGGVRQASISAVVIRAADYAPGIDVTMLTEEERQRLIAAHLARGGRVEDHGRVAFCSSDPAEREAWARERQALGDPRSFDALIKEAS